MPSTKRYRGRGVKDARKMGDYRDYTNESEKNRNNKGGANTVKRRGGVRRSQKARKARKTMTKYW
jgi:hypothetical protein